jgi:hypothetical protein
MWSLNKQVPTEMSTSLIYKKEHTISRDINAPTIQMPPSDNHQTENESCFPNEK